MEMHMSPAFGHTSSSDRKQMTTIVVTLATVLGLEFMKAIAAIVISSIIIKNSPEFYENDWKPQAAVISSLCSSVIGIISMFTIIVITALTDDENTKTKGTAPSSLMAIANIFSMVCVYMSWNSMWDDSLGMAFCILIGIIQPAIFILAIFAVCTLGCIAIAS